MLVYASSIDHNQIFDTTISFHNFFKMKKKGKNEKKNEKLFLLFIFIRLTFLFENIVNFTIFF